MRTIELEENTVKQPWKRMHADFYKKLETAKFGARYTKEKTRFEVFVTEAERVRIEFFDTPEDDNPLIIDMQGEAPFYEIEITGDLEGKYYQYRVRRDGKWHLAQDPWAYSMTENSALAMVVNFENTNPEGWENHSKPQAIARTEAVLYETHIKDTTVSKASNHKQAGTYLGMVEKETKTKEGLSTGLAHLIDLGITHIHLLPLHDMGSVDEVKGGYNWGYDPMYFMTPEGVYSTNPKDGKVRVREFKQMVQGFHEAGIQVVLDVVYNHTYVHETHPFEILAPDWYYRKMVDTTFGNGSGCGNETASESPLFRKYVLDSLKLYLEAYQIDGFRFDLMALHDIEFVKQMEETIKKANPNALIYGEPWTGGKSLLAKTKQFRQGCQKGMATALFNDHIRNAIKGDNDGDKKGFVSNGQRMEKAVASGIAGGIEFDETLHGYAKKPGEVVNYVSCHDNLCLYDKLKKVHPEESDLAIAKRSLMALSIPLLSFGTPFIQGGTEIMRTKYGDHNSFISGDKINAIQWERKAEFLGHFEAIKALIALRKNLKCFAIDDEKWIKKHLSFKQLQSGIIAYEITLETPYEGKNSIVVIHNAALKKQSLKALMNAPEAIVLYDSESYMENSGERSKEGAVSKDKEKHSILSVASQSTKIIAY